MATANKSAWQLFGTNFNTPVTIEEAIEQAHLNYEVEEAPMIRVSNDVIENIKSGAENVTIPTTTENIITSHKVNFRTDNGKNLGVVGSGYGLVQNAKAFEFINFINEVSGQTPMIETAGALGYGERIFITCRLGDNVFLDKDDEIKNYVVFTNSMDGSGAVMAFFSPVRIICQNTLNMAIKGAVNKIVFKHTKYVNERLNWEDKENRRKALEVFSKGVKFTDTFVENMLQLKGENLSKTEITDLTNKLFLTPAQRTLVKQNNNNYMNVEEISTRTKNQIAAFNNALDFGVGQESYRGSKLWYLNGFTTYLQNTKNWKSDEDKFKSMQFGSAATKTQQVYDLLMAA